MSDQIEQPKKKRGRPRGSTKNKREQAAKRQDLALTQRRVEIADLYLAGNAVSEIAETLGVSEEYVSTQLTIVQTTLSGRLADLAERLSALNIARLERLMSIHYPEAVKPAETKDDKESRRSALGPVMRIMDRELEWYKALQKAPTKSDEDSAGNLIQINKFEQTIVAGGELYQRVQTAMQDEWLEAASLPVETLYQQFPSVAHLQERLSDLESAINADTSTDLVDDEETSDGEIADIAIRDIIQPDGRRQS